LPIRVLPPSLNFDRRTARGRSGDGCIRCGCTIYQYCTIDPSPESEEIFLLCPPCRTQLQKSEGRFAVIGRLLQNPVATQAELNRDEFAYSLGRPIPSLMFADGTLMQGIPYPIIFDHVPVLTMLDPEPPGRAYRLSLKLGRTAEAPETLIQSNEWVADEDRWTFARLGNRYAISSRSSEVALRFRVLTSETLAIDYLQTWSAYRQLLIDGASMQVDGNSVPIVGSKAQLRGMAL